MIQSLTIDKPDQVGAAASMLCLIHCLATPLLFVAKSCSLTAACCVDAPLWWQAIDYLFVVVSFFAIFFATKTSTKRWIKAALWSSWGLLTLTILGEKFEPGLFPESFIYLPSLAIVGFHLYNLKYCQCDDEQRCAVA